MTKGGVKGVKLNQPVILNLDNFGIGLNMTHFLP